MKQNTISAKETKAQLRDGLKSQAKSSMSNDNEVYFIKVALGERNLFVLNRAPTLSFSVER